MKRATSQPGLEELAANSETVGRSEPQDGRAWILRHPVEERRPPTRHAEREVERRPRCSVPTAAAHAPRVCQPPGHVLTRACKLLPSRNALSMSLTQQLRLQQSSPSRNSLVSCYIEPA